MEKSRSNSEVSWFESVETDEWTDTTDRVNVPAIYAALTEEYTERRSRRVSLADR